MKMTITGCVCLVCGKGFADCLTPPTHTCRPSRHGEAAQFAVTAAGPQVFTLDGVTFHVVAPLQAQRCACGRWVVFLPAERKPYRCACANPDVLTLFAPMLDPAPPDLRHPWAGLSVSGAAVGVRGYVRETAGPEVTGPYCQCGHCFTAADYAAAVAGYPTPWVCACGRPDAMQVTAEPLTGEE